MRVLQVHNRHRVRGGEDIVVEQEAALLRGHGHDVVSYVVDNPPSAPAAALSLVRAPWNRTAAAGVVRAARRHGAEIVHVHNTWFTLSPAVFEAVSVAGFAVVATLHNYRTVCINGLLLRDGRPCEECVGSGPWRGVGHRCYRGSVVQSAAAAATIALPRRRRTWERAVDRFLVLDGEAVPALAAGGIPAGRVTVCPNFVPDPGERAAPPSHGDTVVFAGRLSEEKGARVLLEAWRHVRPAGSRLTMFGDGPLAAELRRVPVPGVHLAGRVDRGQVASALRTARALVVPSVCREAGPVAPIEAAAAGVPIVVSDRVGYAATVARSGAGWSVPGDDPTALARALDVLADAGAVDRAGAAARRLYLARHTPEAALATLEEAYGLALLHGGDRRVNVRGTGATAA